MGSLLQFWTGLIKRKKYILKGQFDYCYTLVMHWLNVCVNCFLNQWFCYWILKSCCYFEISNNFTAPRWQSAPNECPEFKTTSTSCLLLSSWLLYFFPLDPCLPSAPETSGSQTLAFIWLLREFVEMHIPAPTPQVLIWLAWEPVLLTGTSEAGWGWFPFEKNWLRYRCPMRHQAPNSENDGFLSLGFNSLLLSWWISFQPTSSKINPFLASYDLLFFHELPAQQIWALLSSTCSNPEASPTLSPALPQTSIHSQILPVSPIHYKSYWNIPLRVQNCF